MREMRTAFGEKLVELGRKNDKIYVLDADLNTSTRTDLFRDEFPSRFIQFGIAEQNMFGFAGGMAATGLIPFPTTFSCFNTTRALDMVRTCICYPNLNVKIPGCYAGISTGKAGATHQTVEDIGIMRMLPNMSVLSPADEIEMEQMMDAMMEYQGPVYLRLSKLALPIVSSGQAAFDWAPVILRDGSDVLLCATGFMVHKCLIAAQELEKSGVSAAVLNISAIKPFASEKLIRLAKICGCVVTAEDHSIFGGVGGLVSEVLGENHPVPIKRIGYKDKFIVSASDEDLVATYHLGEADIAAAAKAVIGVKKKLQAGNG